MSIKEEDVKREIKYGTANNCGNCRFVVERGDCGPMPMCERFKPLATWRINTGHVCSCHEPIKEVKP